MKSEKQIVLFLKKGSSYNPVQIAARLNEKFSYLGIPVTLPFDEKNANNPLIIFNKGLIEFSMNYFDATFIFDDKKYIDDILSIVEFLEEEGFDFVRFGYISTFIRTKKERELFKKKVFVNPDDYSEEFNLSKYNSILIDSVRVNVWERNLTDNMSKVEFITVIDINTPVNEEYNITSEFLTDFIPSCDKYIDKKIN